MTWYWYRRQQTDQDAEALQDARIQGVACSVYGVSRSIHQVRAGPGRRWFGLGEARCLTCYADLLVVLLALRAIAENKPGRVDGLLPASRGIGNLRRYVGDQVIPQLLCSGLVCALHSLG